MTMFHSIMKICRRFETFYFLYLFFLFSIYSFYSLVINKFNMELESFAEKLFYFIVFRKLFTHTHAGRVKKTFWKERKKSYRKHRRTIVTHGKFYKLNLLILIMQSRTCNYYNASEEITLFNYLTLANFRSFCKCHNISMTIPSLESSSMYSIVEFILSKKSLFRLWQRKQQTKKGRNGKKKIIEFSFIYERSIIGDKLGQLIKLNIIWDAYNCRSHGNSIDFVLKFDSRFHWKWHFVINEKIWR